MRIGSGTRTRIRLLRVVCRQAAVLDGLVQGLRQHAQEDLDRALRQALGATVGPPQDVFGCCQSLELLVAVKELGLGCRQALSG